MSIIGRSYWLKSGLLTIFQRLSVVLFGFVVFYILIRELGKEEFGSWIIFISITTVIEILRNGFIRNPLVKFITGNDPSSHPKIYTSAFILNFLLTILIAIILGIFAPFFAEKLNTPSLDTLLYIYIITNFAFLPFSHFEFVHISNFNFKGSFYGYFVKQGALVVYILYCLFFELNLSVINLAIFQIFSTCLGGFVIYIMARGYLKFSYEIDMKWLKEMFHFGKYTFGTNIGSMLFGNMDQWMLAGLLSPAAVAIYNPALRMNNLIEVPTWSITSIVFPQLSKRLKEEGNKSAKYLYEKSVGLILSIIVPALIGIIILADQVIILIADESYSEAIPILRITMLYCLFVPFARQFGMVLDSTGKPHVNFLFVFFQLTVNIVCNYLFISFFGVIGAAYGTLLSYFTAFIINQYYLKKNLNINFLRVFRYAIGFYIIGFTFVKEKILKLSRVS